MPGSVGVHLGLSSPRPLSSWNTSRSTSKECHFYLIQLNNKFLISLMCVRLWGYSKSVDMFPLSSKGIQSSKIDAEQATGILGNIWIYKQNPAVYYRVHLCNLLCCVTLLKFLPFLFLLVLPTSWPWSTSMYRSLALAPSWIGQLQVSSASLWRPPVPIDVQGVGPKAAYETVCSRRYSFCSY